MDDIIYEALSNYKPGEITREILDIPETLLDHSLTAIEQVKPPSKWRDMLFLYILSLMGGVGLGLLLALRW